MPKVLFQIQRFPATPSLLENGTRSAGLGVTKMTVLSGCVFLLAAGCSNSHTIRGTVTYNGKPVEKGAISFLPADGQGPSFGAKITEGKYLIADASPGSCRVQIVGVKKINFAKSSAELERMAEEARAAGQDPSDLVDAADVIPEDAKGNNQLVDVQEGDQTLDFHIMPPDR